MFYDPPVYGEKGVPNSANVPGARYGACGWYDNMKHEFWLFGGGSVGPNVDGMFFTFQLNLYCLSN